MNRHLKNAVVLAGVAVLLIVWCGRAGAGPEEKLVLPDAAREAERFYAKQLKDLRAGFEATVREAFKAHVERLTSIQAEYTAAGDLEGALAVRTRLEELRQDPPETAEEKKRSAKVGLRMNDLRGTWMVDWSNGDRRTRTFHGRNGVTAPGSDGHLYRKSGDLVIEYKNGVIERISIGEDRLFFEEFIPAKTYPKGKARAMGIATKVD